MDREVRKSHTIYSERMKLDLNSLFHFVQATNEAYYCNKHISGVSSDVEKNDKVNNTVVSRVRQRILNSKQVEGRSERSDTQYETSSSK